MKQQYDIVDFILGERVPKQKKEFLFIYPKGKPHESVATQIADALKKADPDIACYLRSDYVKTNWIATDSAITYFMHTHPDVAVIVLVFPNKEHDNEQVYRKWSDTALMHHTVDKKPYVNLFIGDAELERLPPHLKFLPAVWKEDANWIKFLFDEIS